MSDSANAEYEQACEEYRRLIGEYGEALATNTPTAGSLLAEAAAAWLRICALAPHGPEAQVGISMHHTLAFSYARAAGSVVEAERVYLQMSDDQRREIDEIDAREPGSMKIWLPK